MITPRIWVELNEWDHVERTVPLPPASIEALARRGIELRDGATVHLYADDPDDAGNRDDLIMDGVAHYDAATGRWYATRLGPIRNVSELSATAVAECTYLD